MANKKEPLPVLSPVELEALRTELNPDDLRFQIQKPNQYNWQIFEWQAGGEKISRGPYSGQLSTPKWMPMESYHPNVSRAAVVLLEIATKAGVPEHIGLDTEAILASVAAAQEIVLAAVAAVEIPADEGDDDES